MARIRTIKPEFFTSEDIVSMTPLARLLYVALWCEADREGRLEWKPGTFKMRYLPGDQCEVVTLADEMVKRGLIVLYEVSGKKYAEIPSFTRHQVINNRESESALPTRPHASSTRAPRVKAEGKEGKEGNGKEPATPFAEFWGAWPKSERKQDKAKCAEKFKAAGLSEVLPAILADIAIKKQTEKWRAGFIEAPEVYLNNRRWEDGVTPGEADLSERNTAAEQTADYLARQDAEFRANDTPENRERVAAAIADARNRLTGAQPRKVQ
jgi:hypothetical protein